MTDMLRALCMGCDKDEPHYKFYRVTDIIYAHCGSETVGADGRIICQVVLYYACYSQVLEKLSREGSYRNPEEKRIKLTPDFFSLSTIEKENNLRGGKYDI